MWISTSKKFIRAGAQIIRQISNFADDLGENLIEAKKVFLNDQDNKKNVKSLKIAFLGLPNAGKSTLINHLIGRPICATSTKIHTTRAKATAIFNTNDTQLIFIDTPGLVGQGDYKRYNLEDSFRNDPKKSVEEADVIGIVQDMTNKQARESINEKIINVFKFYKTSATPILILNKVDTMKNKKLLLEVVKKLTDKDIWPYFSDVFMISALTGDGVSDLRNYFLDSAKYKIWEYDKNTLYNQPYDVLIQQIVKAKFLDNLPQELPYLVNINVEHIEYCQDCSISIVINVNCPSLRIARIVIGKAGSRVKKIARDAEQTLCSCFLTNVRLKIVVPMQEESSLTKHVL